MTGWPRRWRFILLVPAAACVALAVAVAVAVAAEDRLPEDAPAEVTREGEDATDPAAALPPDQVPEFDDTWTSSPDPAARFWHITPYLKGTPADVRRILETQVTEFDEKIVNVLSDIAQNERNAASLIDEALSAARAAPAYQAARAQTDAAKADLDAGRAVGASVNERMTASARYNKAKAEVDRLERQAVARTSAAAIRAANYKLQARADVFYARRGEALAWRQKLVNAILLGQTMRGRLVPGETVGLLADAKIERVTEDRAVLARFPLMQSHQVIGDKEGVKQIQGRVEEVSLLIRGVDDVHRLRPKQEFAVWQAFKVTGMTEVDGSQAYVLDPYPCDFNVLLAAITKPPTLKAPPRGIAVGGGGGNGVTAPSRTLSTPKPSPKKPARNAKE